MAWVILVVAGVLESAWALGMKQSEGFTRPVPTTLTIVAIAASMVLLAVSLRSLPVGPAYAVWVAIGILGTLVGSTLWFEETLSARQLGFAALLGVGVLGLALSSDNH